MAKNRCWLAKANDPHCAAYANGHCYATRITSHHCVAQANSDALLCRLSQWFTRANSQYCPAHAKAANSQFQVARAYSE